MDWTSESARLSSRMSEARKDEDEWSPIAEPLLGGKSTPFRLEWPFLGRHASTTSKRQILMSDWLH